MLNFGRKKFSRYSSRALSDFDFRLLVLQKQSFLFLKFSFCSSQWPEREFPVLSSKKRKLFQPNAYRLSPKHNDFFRKFLSDAIVPSANKTIIFRGFSMVCQNKVLSNVDLKEVSDTFSCNKLLKYWLLPVFDHHTPARTNTLHTQTLHVCCLRTRFARGVAEHLLLLLQLWIFW